MKKFILFLFVFSITIAAQSLPTSGKSYTIKYDPSEKNIFTTKALLAIGLTAKCLKNCMIFQARPQCRVGCKLVSCVVHNAVPVLSVFFALCGSIAQKSAQLFRQSCSPAKPLRWSDRFPGSRAGHSNTAPAGCSAPGQQSASHRLFLRAGQ